MILNRTCTAAPRLVAVQYVLFFISLLIGSTALALPSKHLNGVATYNHMGKDYYLVAHYTAKSCEEAITCEEASSPSRFLLKIITPRWTSHSYSLVWQRELSSNNNLTLDKENMEALLAFTRIAETQLTYGDIIDLVFDGSDTTIAVNKVFAVRTKGKILFNYIGRVWLGPVPPSRDFQQRMLAGHSGPHDQADLARFKAIQPSPNRMSLLDTWLTQKDEVVLAPPKKVKRESTSPVPISIAKAVSPKPVAVALDANVRIIPAVDIAAPAIKPEVAREQQLATLEWHIHNTILRQVKYPSWAKQFGQEGSVSVTFTLDDSLALLSIDNIKPKNAGLLGEAVTDAIESTQPFSFPAGITSKVKTLTSTYQHEFSLSKAASDVPKPAGISDATFKQLLTIEANKRDVAPASVDTDALSAHLKKHVDYPYWAKSLGLKGTVKAFVTLNAQGQLEDVTIMEGSRHAGFDKAIKIAAKKAAPYPLTPQNLDSDTLISFDYLHVFTP